MTNKLKKINKKIKKLEKLTKSTTTIDVLTIALGLATLIIPAIPSLIYEAKKKLLRGPGFLDRDGNITSTIEIDGVRVEGEEILQVAREGLAARAKRAREEQEREFDRKVAKSLEKALQGKGFFKDVKATTSQQYSEV
jgi:hypothetical protein